MTDTAAIEQARQLYRGELPPWPQPVRDLRLSGPEQAHRVRRALADTLAGRTGAGNAYYNDLDPKACAWTQELITQGQIAPGIVDCRSITEIEHDLSKFAHCHFFNGISGWAYALDLAGWPRNRPVWCASLPCQSFSGAGKGAGFEDPRGQLWQPFLALVRQYRPDCIFGEQVQAAIGFGWLDRVFTDLEAEGYTCGATVLGAHSAGAPHIRQRIYWMADANSARSQGRGREELRECAAERAPGASGDDDGLADTQSDDRRSELQPRQPRADGWTGFAGSCPLGGLANADGGDACTERQQRSREHGQQQESGGTGGLGNTTSDDEWRKRKSREVDRREIAPGGSSTWSDYYTVPCWDGKSRRIGTGIRPLATGIPNRVALLRGAGNALCAPTAALFIRAFMSL